METDKVIFVKCPSCRKKHKSKSIEIKKIQKISKKSK